MVIDPKKLFKELKKQGIKTMEEDMKIQDEKRHWRTKEEKFDSKMDITDKYNPALHEIMEKNRKKD